GVERDREQRAALPLKGPLARITLLPDFGRAPAFDDEHDLLVEVMLDVERPGRGNLDHVHAPEAFGTVELDIGPTSAKPSPWRHRQVLHPPYADAAVDRHTLRLHEAVVGHRFAQELAETRVLAGLGLVPMDLIGRVMHGIILGRSLSLRLV